MKEYYIIIQGEQVGPVSINELHHIEIKPDTLIWTEGMDNWTKAEQIEEVKKNVKKTPPPISKRLIKEKQVIFKMKYLKWIILFCFIVCIALIIGSKVYNYSIFLRHGTFVDSRDNQTYKWIKIGKQTWMAENLNYITNESYCYNHNVSNCQKYGRLYTWEVATKYACPDGWHLPTDDEWKELEIYLGMSQEDANIRGWSGSNEGSKLAGNSSLWANGKLENDETFGSSGFMALPAGTKNYDVTYSSGRFVGGSFNDLRDKTYFWSDSESEYDAEDAWFRCLCYNYSGVISNDGYKGYHYSVRCIKDN